MKKRIKRFEVHPAFFAGVFIEGRSFTCSSGLPGDIKVSGVVQNPENGTWVIFVESDTFEEVELGSEVPMIGPFQLDLLEVNKLG